MLETMERPHSPMQVMKDTSPTDIETLWNSLISEHPIQDIHSVFPLIKAWEEIFTHPGEVETVVMQGSDGAALLPLMRRKDQKMKIPLRVLYCPHNYYWWSGYPLVGGNVESSLEALLQHMKTRSDWDMLELGPMFRGWEGVDILMRHAERLSMTPRAAIEVVPTVNVRGEWDAYYRERSKSFRETLDKRERRIEKRHGELRLEEFRSHHRLDEAIAELYRVESSGWKGKEGTAINSQPQTAEFFAKLAHVAADHGWLRLYLLYSGDQCIAAQLGLCYRQILYLLKFGYDDEWSSFSPGNVLLKRLFQQAFEDPDVDVVDFLSYAVNENDYKLSWSDGSHEYHTLQLFNPKSLSARMFLSGLSMKKAAEQIRHRVQDPR